MNDAFEKLAPFIQEYIYKSKWKELRDIQIAACECIFNTQDNLLLASGTASGKTEAAFLPVISKIYKEKIDSVSVLYISPLKALINDQFERLNDLLKEAIIPVTKWHGDASAGGKEKLRSFPKGILQTTPESLEAMLVLRRHEIKMLFSDLRYIIIDEVHTFMGSGRGIHLLCILERIQRDINRIPIRIGLSATLGDYTYAEKYLSAGTNRACQVPLIEEKGRRVKLLVDYPEEDEFFLDLYYRTLNKQCIIFSNSKAEVEENITSLRRIAKEKGTMDAYKVHHGNISKSMREEAEKAMKTGEVKTVVGATLTLELGIDVGDLEMIVQTGAPLSVSSFVQRLGRSGRKSGVGVMYFTFREKPGYGNMPIDKIDWELVKCIAVIELYLKERWIEPVVAGQYPYEILLHQTLSHVASVHETRAAKLAEYMLTMSPFRNISQEDYRIMLLKMIDDGLLERTEEGFLHVGSLGEAIISNFDFFSVFETAIEYSVIYENREIGQVMVPYEEEETFSLAGRAWQVVSIDKSSHVIHVKPHEEHAESRYKSDMRLIVPSKLVAKMFEVLSSDKAYNYLGKRALERLFSSRKRFSALRIRDNVMQAGDKCLFLPRLGTKEIMYYSCALRMYGYENEIRYLSFVPIYISIPGSYANDVRDVVDKIEKHKPDKFDFHVDVYDLGGKLRKFVPDVLTRKEFIADYIG
ncbi:MAG: DEAD/DEAH box helicase [Clostridiaceae bacterium]|nr:DEAD/DEAH box helicase [Clostridiaceae bacterium]